MIKLPKLRKDHAVSCFNYHDGEVMSKNWCSWKLKQQQKLRNTRRFTKEICLVFRDFLMGLPIRLICSLTNQEKKHLYIVLYLCKDYLRSWFWRFLTSHLYFIRDLDLKQNLTDIFVFLNTIFALLQKKLIVSFRIDATGMIKCTQNNYVFLNYYINTF